jgi:RHS repeat-associated protein
MKPSSFLKRASFGFLLLATGVIGRADNGIDLPSWQIIPFQTTSSPTRTSSAAATPAGNFAPLGLFSGPSPTASTTELQVLATGLDNDPVKIFNYVHNQIDFQPYYGSLKGAQVTYLDRAGNDFDQASLLIALLNLAATNNPQINSVNYVYGSCTVPTANLSNWLGNWIGTSQVSPNAIFNNTGIPNSAGASNTWTFDHVWVEVTINGTVYDLDPSYKQYQLFSPIDYKTASGYNRANLLGTAGGTTDGTNYVQNMSRANVESQLGTYAMNLRNYIKTNYPNVETEQIVGGGHILPQPITALAQGAPPAVFASSAKFNAIPVQYRATYEINLDSGTIDETFYTDSLQGTRLSLVFDTSGNAQLWLGDTMVTSESNSPGSGTTASATLNFTDPFGAASQSLPRSGTITYNRGTGLGTPASYAYDLTYSVFPNSQSSGLIDESTRQIQNYLASGLSNTSRQVLTETLHSLGLKWIRRVALNSMIVGKVQNDFYQLDHIFGRTGQEAGYYVDMPGVAGGTFNTSGTDAHSFNAHTILSSAMEHGVIEQNLVTVPPTPALSTVKCLALANDQGQPIFLATPNNYSSIVGPQLTNYSSSELNNFSSLVNSGFIVLLHKNGQTGINQWSGYGYGAISSNFVSMAIGGTWGSSSGGYNSVPGTINGTDQNTVAQDQSTQIYYPPSLPPDYSAEPVDLLTGAYTMTHADLTLGEQGSPRGLNFTRYYDSSRNFTASPLGNGWRHSCQGLITFSSELDNAFGLTQPTDAAQTIVGAIAIGDFVASQTPQEMMVGILAANWTVNRITNNAANVQLGQQEMTYISQPDGTWNPPPGSTTALTGANGSFALQPRFGGSIAFDSQNRISTSTDVDGNTQAYTYDGNGNLSTVTDHFGRTLTFNYVHSGSAYLLQSVVDSTGRSVQFGYAVATSTGVNSPSNLTGITDPENFSTTLVYDGRNRLTDWKDNNLAEVTHNDYDVLDRVYQQLSQNISTHTWQFHYSPGTTFELDPQNDETATLFDYKSRQIGTIDALGNATSTSYDGQNHVIQTVDATNRQTAYAYDGNENLFTSTDNNNKVTHYYYDGSLRLQKVTDATNRSTQYGYDSHNHLTSVTDPGSRMTQYFYRGDGLLDHVLDPANHTTSYTAYDSYGNPTNVTRADGTKTSATYNARGDLLTSTDGRNQTTSFTYDNRRQMLTAKDAYQHTTTWVYDSNGNPSTVVNRNGNTTTSIYDNLGHVQSVQSPNTGPIISYYDPRDWLTSVTDSLGHATTYGYNAAGRRISITNALTIMTTQWSYDAAGRVSVQKDGLLHQTKFFYDAVGRLQYLQDPLYSSQNPLSHVIGYTYDDAGRKLTLVNKRNQSFGFGYGTDGLSTTFTYPSNRESQITARDAHGSPTTLLSPAGNQTILTYDAMSRLLTSADGVSNIGWIYDNEGNATDVKETIASTTTDIQRGYDNLNRLTSCTDTLSNAVGYSYDNEGNLATLTYPGNKTVIYAYDGSNRLKTVTDWAGRVTTYNYDTAGRLQTVVRPNGTRQRVTLDAANRLTASYEELLNSSGTVTNTLWSALYGYDNTDRLTSFQPFPMEQCLAPPAATLTYDGDNQLGTYNGQNLSHDLNGNLLSAPVSGTLLGPVTWDVRDRLLTAGGVTYTYDAENRRTSSTINGQTTQYIWSRGSLDQLLEKINPDGSVTRYIYGKGLLYEETTSAGNVAQSPVFYHFDWRGDTVALSDANGNVTARLSYNAYGERTVMSGPVNTPFCFNGKWGVMTEPSGLLSMQARFYSPVFRRFLNEDPSGFAGGTNMYAYATGDPVNLMDPFGLGPVGADSGGGPSVTETIATVVGVAALAILAPEVLPLLAEEGAAAAGAEAAGTLAVEGTTATAAAGTETAAAMGAETTAAAATESSAAVGTQASAANVESSVIQSTESAAAPTAEAVAPAESEGGLPQGVTRNANGGVDFSNSPDLYPAQEGQSNTVKIEYTGSRRQDFGAANRAGNIGTTQQPPADYTWHHLDDYDPETNTGTMQLVKRTTHEATYPHIGGVKQFIDATGRIYK